MYFVYILQSLKDGRTYVGHAQDLEARLKKHNSGQVNSTRYRRPLTLLFKENFETLEKAKNREIWWKSGSGRQRLKEIFEANKSK
jgi:putative endonuclease